METLKKYVTPQMEFIAIDDTDVIITSSGGEIVLPENPFNPATKTNNSEF